MRRVFVLLAGIAACAVTPAGAREPRDPSWPFDWAQHRVRMPQVWDYTTGSPNVVIGAVDTGVDEQLPDLAGAFAPGWDFAGSDAVVDDTHGHGTLVASELVARGDNSISISGYCWQCRLMPLRVSRSGEANDDLIATAIRWAVDQGVRVINVGFVQESGTPPDATVGAAVQYAVAHDVLVIASAGNTGSDALTYPGAYPGVLAVAGTNEDDRLYQWSTRGQWVQLAAPGCQAVISMVGTWGWLCGSSFTAPVVTAVAALALSLNPGLTAERIRQALIATAVPVAGIGGGRVDAFAALQYLGVIPSRSTSPPPPPPPPPPPAPPSGGKTAGVAKRSARVVTGQFSGRLRVPFDVGAGRLNVTLRVSSIRRCHLAVTSPTDVLLPTLHRRNTLGIAARVAAGHYLVDASCAKHARRHFRLTISAPAPPPSDNGG